MLTRVALAFGLQSTGGLGSPRNRDGRAQRHHPGQKANRTTQRLELVRTLFPLNSLATVTAEKCPLVQKDEEGPRGWAAPQRRFACEGVGYAAENISTLLSSLELANAECWSAEHRALPDSRGVWKAAKGVHVLNMGC